MQDHGWMSKTKDENRSEVPGWILDIGAPRCLPPGQAMQAV